MTIFIVYCCVFFFNPFALKHTFLLDRLIVPCTQRQICGESWRDVLFYLYVWAEERPSSVSSIFPSSFLASDLYIAFHPSAMSAFYSFVKLPNATARDVSGCFHVIRWHCRRYLLSKLVYGESHVFSCLHSFVLNLHIKVICCSDASKFSSCFL